MYIYICIYIYDVAFKLQRNGWLSTLSLVSRERRNGQESNNLCSIESFKSLIIVIVIIIVVIVIVIVIIVIVIVLILRKVFEEICIHPSPHNKTPRILNNKLRGLNILKSIFKGEDYF